MTIGWPLLLSVMIGSGSSSSSDESNPSVSEASTKQQRRYLYLHALHFHRLHLGREKPSIARTCGGHMTIIMTICYRFVGCWSLLVDSGTHYANMKATRHGLSIIFLGVHDHVCLCGRFSWMSVFWRHGRSRFGLVTYSDDDHSFCRT
jgi:hypothetical protein